MGLAMLWAMLRAKVRAGLEDFRHQEHRHRKHPANRANGEAGFRPEHRPEEAVNINLERRHDAECQPGQKQDQPDTVEPAARGRAINSRDSTGKRLIRAHEIRAVDGIDNDAGDRADTT